MTKNPTLQEFLGCARQEYRFLIDEFGFSESMNAANPFEVDYSNSVLRVTVEGINWGYGVQVLLIPFRAGSARIQESVPLWAIAQLRCPTDLDQVQRDSGQLAQLRSYAQILRASANDVLRGDFTIFPAAAAVVAGEPPSKEPKKSYLP
jgi:hypothetical protein